MRGFPLKSYFFGSFPDVFPEESDGEGGGGAKTEASEIRAEPPGLPEQRARPSQENGGGVTILS